MQLFEDKVFLQVTHTLYTIASDAVSGYDAVIPRTWMLLLNQGTGLPVSSSALPSVQLWVLALLLTAEQREFGFNNKDMLIK